MKELVCALCDKRQPVSQQCQQCQVTFGVYTCMECVFFDDNTEKKQFHCDDCGICRVGGREKYFHCKTCGCCYDKKLLVWSFASLKSWHLHMFMHAVCEHVKKIPGQVIVAKSFFSAACSYSSAARLCLKLNTCLDVVLQMQSFSC